MGTAGNVIEFRSFRAGDGPKIADSWTLAAPGDGITYERFRNLILLDRNFDANGLIIASRDDQVAGVIYAVRRLVAAEGDNLERESGWIPFFFVHPDARRMGLGTQLVQRAMAWLKSHGCRQVFFSSYTPNYFLPGLDAQRYPVAMALLTGLGFKTEYESVAMDRSLNDYQMPTSNQDKITALRAKGYFLGSPSSDDLVDLIEIAGNDFNPDWGRAIREAVLSGLPNEQILVARSPAGSMLGWAIHGAYENVLERFGPFGVLTQSRGTGLGEALLHLTLERMRALGGHSAWFLWTDEESPAGHLYAKTGFSVTRTFAIMKAQLS